VGSDNSHQNRKIRPIDDQIRRGEERSWLLGPPWSNHVEEEEEKAKKTKRKSRERVGCATRSLAAVTAWGAATAVVDLGLGRTGRWRRRVAWGDDARAESFFFVYFRISLVTITH
jgi:hypothetical protein